MGSKGNRVPITLVATEGQRSMAPVPTQGEGRGVSMAPIRDGGAAGIFNAGWPVPCLRLHCATVGTPVASQPFQALASRALGMLGGIPHFGGGNLPWQQAGRFGERVYSSTEDR